jgi:hypothetical protein
MNNERRKELELILEQLHPIRDRVVALSLSELDAWANRPENIRNPTSKEAPPEAVADLDEAKEHLEKCIMALSVALTTTSGRRPIPLIRR